MNNKYKIILFGKLSEFFFIKSFQKINLILHNTLSYIQKILPLPSLWFSSENPRDRDKRESRENREQSRCCEPQRMLTIYKPLFYNEWEGIGSRGKSEDLPYMRL